MGWLDAVRRRGSRGPGPAVAITLSDWFPGVPAAGAGERGRGPACHLPERERGQAAAGDDSGSHTKTVTRGPA